MRKSIFTILLLLLATVVQAQIQEPVKFKSELKTLSGNEAEVVFIGTIEKGWHVYSTDLGDGGPISATFNAEKLSGAEVVGKLKPVGKEISAFSYFEQPCPARAAVGVAALPRNPQVEMDGVMHIG